MDKNTENITQALRLFMKGISLNQIAKRAGLDKNHVKTLIKTENWKKIQRLAEQILQKTNGKGQICDFVLWILGSQRNDFIQVAQLALEFDSSITYPLDNTLKIDMELLQSISNDMKELEQFLSYLYHKNRTIYDNIFEVATDFAYNLDDIKTTQNHE